MNYETVRKAYMQANQSLEEQDKAAVKAIADKAIADLATAQSETNANYDNAVAAAYRQANAPTQTASERYALQGNAGNIEHNYRQNQGYDNRAIQNLRTATNAKTQKLNADITALYGGKRLEVAQDLDEKRKAQEDAIIAQREKEKAQEGVMEQLQQLSIANNYNYDFDADIFELERQGLKSSDWQIQFLKEAKRRQAQALKELKASQKSTSGGTGGGGGTVEAPTTATQTPRSQSNNATSTYKQLKERIGTYLNSPTGRQHTAQLIERIQIEQEAGHITEAEADKLITLFKLGE